MVQFHVDASSGGELRSALVASPVEGSGPGCQVLLADNHPDSVNVAEQANGAELFFMGSTRFRDEGDDVVAQGLRPAPCTLPLIHE